jgi:hypothetical protein
MSKWTQWAALGVALLFAACATSGPLSAPVVGGVAAALAALDQLLASGLIDQAQYVALKGGFEGVGEVSVAIDAVRQQVEAVKGGGLSPEATGGIAAGSTAALLALLKAWGSFANLRKAAKARAA